MEILHEEWRPVAGRFAGWPYEVSNRGQVRISKDIPYSAKCIKGTSTDPGRMLALLTTKGYAAVHIRKDGRRLLVRVHILVANAFIPNPEGKPHINHKDSNRQNASVENLEWCTPKENTKHAWRSGRMENVRTASRTRRLNTTNQ